MKKIKKLIIPLFITIFIVYGIYNFYNDDKINYVALGDSLAAGENPYKEIGYGYADNIKEYLESKDKLNSYTKDYAQSGDTTEDLLEKIQDNVKVKMNEEEVGIKRALREAHLVTISIGANDLLRNIDMRDMQLASKEELEDIEEEIELITESVENVIAEVKKFAKKDILLIGYYNPINKNLLKDKKMDEFIDKIDSLYTEICAKQEITYIKISDIFKEHDDYLPNPFNIHPNYKGYEAISDKIIAYLEKKNKNLA